MKLLPAAAVAAISIVGCGPAAEQGKLADTLLLKDYEPVSIFNVPVTKVDKAKYPVIDMHTHDYVDTPEEVDEVVKIMDACGVEQAHIMQCNWISDTYDVVAERYA